MDNHTEPNISEEKNTPNEQTVQQSTEPSQSAYDIPVQSHNMSLPDLPYTSIPGKKKKNKLTIFTTSVACILFVLLVASLIPSSDEIDYNRRIDALNATIEGLNGRLNRYKKYEETGGPYEQLQSEHKQLQEDYQALTSEYEDYKLETADYVALSEEERSAFAAYATLNEEERSVLIDYAKEQAKAEEEARKAEVALGYETGITYKDIARNPDDYKGKKVKFTGYVKQILEGYIYNDMRMSTSGEYDDIIYATYSSSLVDGRLLEDDHITICGTVSGLKTYTSVLGSTITLPKISIDQIEILND